MNHKTVLSYTWPLDGCLFLLCSNGYNCMTSLRASHDPTALDQYNKTFNGHIYQPDEQCQHYRNGSSYLCRVSLRVLIMKMVVSKSKCVENNCADKSQNWKVHNHSTVSTSEDKRISEKSEDAKGGNQKSLRIPKGIIRKIWGYQRG